MFRVSSKGCAVGKKNGRLSLGSGRVAHFRVGAWEEGGCWGWWGGDAVGAGDAVELVTENGGDGGGGFFGLWHDGESRRGRGSCAFVACVGEALRCFKLAWMMAKRNAGSLTGFPSRW